MGQIGHLAPEIVAQHPHVTSECADLGHVVDGRHVEFNAACFIAAGPGTKFTLYPCRSATGVGAFPASTPSCSLDRDLRWRPTVQKERCALSAGLFSFKASATSP